MEERKFVVPFFNGQWNAKVKDHKGNPVMYEKEVVEEIIAPVRDLIIENDRRRK